MSETLVNGAAEWSVVAALLTDPTGQLVAEVVGAQLQRSDFVRTDAGALFAGAVEHYFADKPVEALSVAEPMRHQLAECWGIAAEDVPEALLVKLKERDYGAQPMDHVAIVKRLSTGRKLLRVVESASSELMVGTLTPEEVAARMGTEALAVTSGTQSRGEIQDWMETGTELAKHLQRVKLARERGIELAIYTGYPFVDDYTRGIAPGEMAVIAGQPGVGKSGFGWGCAQGFAEKQMVREPEHRVGTLVVSMEMGLVASATRLAQSITDINGIRLRSGEIDDGEYLTLLREWKARDGLPIYFNYASNFRLSQLRALIVEAIRRHNVGFVIIDHFRQLDTDRYVRDPNEADEVKARFLKESVAKDLAVGVLCLAHTIKIGRASEGNPRPKLADLRGSGQIAGAADFVAFLHKPGRDMDEAERAMLDIRDNDMEIGWEKSRHAEGGWTTYTFDPVHMTMSVR